LLLRRFEALPKNLPKGRLFRGVKFTVTTKRILLSEGAEGFENNRKKYKINRAHSAENVNEPYSERTCAEKIFERIKRKYRLRQTIERHCAQRKQRQKRREFHKQSLRKFPAFIYLSKFSTVILSYGKDSIKSDGLKTVILYLAKFIIWFLSTTGVASSSL
jgi:hypothetical protein